MAERTMGRTTPCTLRMGMEKKLLGFRETIMRIHFEIKYRNLLHSSDSLLEEFADELALLDPFPPGNEDVDVEAELREIELLVNRDPSTNFSPTITIDPNPEKFTDEPFDDNYNSNNINPLFKEMLEDVESKDSNVSNFDKPVLLNTPLFDKDECFDPGGNIDEIDAFYSFEVLL
ncbi:hypothetical protein Tco_0414032 [Tanacetum coccineum]